MISVGERSVLELMSGGEILVNTYEKSFMEESKAEIKEVIYSSLLRRGLIEHVNTLFGTTFSAITQSGKDALKEGK